MNEIDDLKCCANCSSCDNDDGNELSVRCYNIEEEEGIAVVPYGVCNEWTSDTLDYLNRVEVFKTFNITKNEPVSNDWDS